MSFFRLLLLIGILFFSSPIRAMVPTVVGDSTIPNAHQVISGPVNTGREGKMSTLAVIGFICAILVPPVGILLSAMALHRVKKTHERGRTLALIGMIVGFSLCAMVILGSVIFAFSGGLGMM